MKISFLKSTILYAFLALLTAATFSCSPEDGAQGPKGDKGEQGPKGEDGNANVYASEWINTNFESGLILSFFDISEEKITQDIVDSGTVLAYGKDDDYALSIPFTYDYKTYYTVITDGSIRFIAASTDSSTKNFNDFTQVRYVIIPASNANSRLAVNYNEMSYKELMDYLNLDY